MIRRTLAGMTCLSLVVAGSLTVAAQETQRSQQKDRVSQIGQQRDRQDRNDGQQSEQNNERRALPESLEQLDLNEQQKQAIMAIYRDTDRKAQQIWDRVQEAHRQAISMEAAVIAAARLEGHDHSAHTAQSGQQSSSSQDQQSGTRKEQSTNEGIASSDDAASTRSALKPAADVDNRSENQNGRQQNSRESASGQRDSHADDPSGRSETGQASRWKGLSGDVNVVALRVAVAQPNGRVREYFLTQPVSQDENNETCQKCQAHQNELMQVWKDIHKGHEQLVELEANTIVQVEAQLTTAQLDQLDRARAQTSNGQQDGNRRRNSNSNDSSRQ